MAKGRNGKDLSSLIINLSEAERCKLLEGLTNWYHSKNSKLRGYSKDLELRGYPREPFRIPVELSKNGLTFRCMTQNISTSGVFVQTDFSFHIDQKVSMILSPPKIGKDITVGGRIVRVDSRGIGVKFDELLRDI
jgi:hypothetical protein